MSTDKTIHTLPAPALAPVVTQPARVGLDLIHPSPLNPRRVAKDERDALAASLRAVGQLMPLWVRPHAEIPGAYELVDGERRWWGLQAAGIESARVEVGDFSNEDILRIAWTTGTEGKGLTPIEQARWAAAAMNQPGATVTSVGALVGVQHSALVKKLTLLKLPDFVQNAIQAGELSAALGYLIASVPGALQAKFAKDVMEPEDVPGPLTRVEAEALRRANYARPLKGAPFNPEDAGLVPHAGPCSTCRYRWGNNQEEYGPTKALNTCMHVGCFEEKAAAWRARAVAQEEGKRSLTQEENAAVFPAGASEPAPASGYVPRSRPIPADLLKAEVAAERAPSFAEISPSAPVYVGTAGDGRLVELVSVAEALVAATEPALFRPEVVLRHGLRDNEAGTHRNAADEVVTTPALRDVAPEPVKGSLAAEEKRAQRAEKAAEKSKAKKLRACAEWMLELFDSLVAPAGIKPAGYAYTRASLKWEHLIRSVPDEDALLVLRALIEDDPAKGQTGKDALKEYVAGIGGAAELEGVCDLLLIASALRAQGAEADWVIEWHRHLVEPIGPQPKSGEEQALADLERSHDEQAEAAAKLPTEDERAVLIRLNQEGKTIEEIAEASGVPQEKAAGFLKSYLGEAPWSNADKRLNELRCQVSVDMVKTGVTGKGRSKFIEETLGRAKGGTVNDLTEEEARKVIAALEARMAGAGAA